jgi:hypothetical protein
LSARLGLADLDCVSRYFVKSSSRIVLGIHGSDLPGSEIGCFEPGNVFWQEPYEGFWQQMGAEDCYSANNILIFSSSIRLMGQPHETESIPLARNIPS